MKYLPRFIRHAFDKCYTYVLIKISGLFDADWYIQTYYDVLSTDMSPLKHFLKKGYKQGYDPSTKFSCIRYMTAYPMVIGWNPLIHYLKKGRYHGYKRYGIYNDKQKREQKSIEEPLISVIITSFNYGPYIDQTLRSVVSQTYQNFEIIVVDDGSKDNSVQVISQYVRKYDNVSLYQHPNRGNRGLISSILLGIKHSKGQYIAFCESDDFWTSNHLEEKVQIINQYEDVVVISNNVELIGNETNIIERKEYVQSINQLLRNGGNTIDLQHFQECNWIPTFSAVMIKTDVIKKLNFDSPIPAWIDFWLYRQILKDNLLFYIDTKLTFWRQHYSYNVKQNASQNMKVFMPESNKLIGIKTKQTKVPRCIKKSHLFNKNYYQAQLREHENVQSLIHHYYTIGWTQGLNPSKYFDGDAYLSLNTDVISMSLCPLFHYEAYGKDQHRRHISVDKSNANSIKRQDIDSIKKRREKQKVALLISHELSLTGAPRALFNLAKSLKKVGVYPVIVSPKDGELRNEIEENKIECKIVMALVSHATNFNSLKIPFSEYVKEFDFVLLNTLDLVPIVESFVRLEVKKLCWIHEGTMGFDNSIYNGKLTYYLSMFDQVFVVGDYVHEILRQRTKNRIEASNFLYGIEDYSSPLFDKSEDKTKIHMAIVGTIDYRKGHDILIDSIEYIPIDVREKIEISILGKSIDKTIATKINNCHNIDIRMIGEVEHHKLLEIMESIDVLICPSRDDPMPIVCTEAMMLSKPIIVSTHTGTASFIHNGINGFVFGSGSPNQLANAIVNAVNNSDILPEMGIRARQVYENYFSLEQFEKNIKSMLT